MAKAKKKAPQKARKAKATPKAKTATKAKASKKKAPAPRKKVQKAKKVQKKAPAKSAPARKVAAKKAAPRKAAPKKPVARKAAPKKVAKAQVKKAQVKKAQAKKTPVKKAQVKKAQTKQATVKKAPAKKAVARAAAKAPAAPPPPARLNRDRKRLADVENTAFSAEADDSRLLQSARSGHNELASELRKHTETSPELTAGDVDANWQDAYAVGDEAPGGDNPTPDQDRVDDIGRALGVEYDDDEELMGGAEITERDSHRWELDPASRDDDE